jgi:hypothetical protein
MSFFKRLPEIIEARQLNQDNIDEFIAWVKSIDSNVIAIGSQEGLLINNDAVYFGDYIKIRNTDIFPEGGFDIVKQAFFEISYKPAKKFFYKRIPDNIEAVLLTKETLSEVILFSKKYGFEVEVYDSGLKNEKSGINILYGEYVLSRGGVLFGIPQNVFTKIYKQLRNIPAKHSSLKTNINGV